MFIVLFLAVVTIAVYFYFLYIFDVWILLYFMIAGVVVTCLAVWLMKYLRKISSNRPYLNEQQKVELEKARKADQLARAENIKAREIAKQQWKSDRQNRMAVIDNEISAVEQELLKAKQELNEHITTLDSMDCLCDEDKQLQTIELLIYLIKNKRADTVKEALQRYDDLLCNEQVMEAQKKKLELEIKDYSAFEKSCIDKDTYQSRQEYITKIINN